LVDGEDQISWQHQNYNSPVSIPDNSLLVGMLEKGLDIAKGRCIVEYVL
jgi:UDP-glucose:tetrahydrobiopterin glucosyltransferase